MLLNVTPDSSGRRSKVRSPHSVLSKNSLSTEKSRAESVRGSKTAVSIFSCNKLVGILKRVKRNEGIRWLLISNSRYPSAKLLKKSSSTSPAKILVSERISLILIPAISKKSNSRSNTGCHIFSVLSESPLKSSITGRQESISVVDR